MQQRYFILGILAVLIIPLVHAVCPDGTQENQCSANPGAAHPDSWGQPYKCVNSTLIPACNDCGCFGAQQSCRDPGRGDCTVFPNIRLATADYSGGAPDSGTEQANKFTAEHFDISSRIDDLGWFRKYTNAFVAEYDNYFDMYWYEDKYNYLKMRAQQDGYPFEDLFFHFRTDTEWSGNRTIPGWNPLNDPNQDGVNDYLYTELRSYQWSNTATFTKTFGTDVQWVNMVWVYTGNNTPYSWYGNSFTLPDPLNFGSLPQSAPVQDVTQAFAVSFTTKGQCSPTCSVSIPSSASQPGTKYVFVEVFGMKQSGALDPNAHASNKSQSRARDYYWTGPGQTNGATQRFMANMNNSKYQLYNAENARIVATTPEGHDNIYHLSGIMIDNALSDYDWMHAAVGEILEFPETWDLTGNTLHDKVEEVWIRSYAQTMAAAKIHNPDKIHLPNCVGTCHDLYIPWSDYQGQEAYFREAGRSVSQYIADADKGASLKKALISVTINDVGDTERNKMSMLALHYIILNDYTYLQYGGSASNPYLNYFPALSYNIGNPLARASLILTAPDPTDPSHNYNIWSREYERALVLYKERTASSQSFDTSTATTISLQGRYFKMNSDGTLSSLVTQVSLANGQGVVLIKEESLLPCTVGATRNCGPITNYGVCEYGTQTCMDQGTGINDGRWGTCTGAVYPQVESCQDGIDQDCNGADLQCQECQVGTAPLVGCLCNGNPIVYGEYCPYGPGGSVIFQNGFQGYTGSSDACITSQQPDTQPGCWHVVQNRDEYVIHFNLSSLNPTDRAQSATLSLYNKYDSGGTSEVRIYRLLKPWTATGVTWRCTNDEGFNGCVSPEIPWSTPGALTLNSDIGSDYASTTVTGLTGTWYTWNVTPIVSKWLDGSAQNYGFVVMAAGSPGHTFTLSNSNWKPKLEVIVTSAPTTSCGSYDTDQSNTISALELNAAIQDWYADKIGITQLLAIFKFWKRGICS